MQAIFYVLGYFMYCCVLGTSFLRCLLLLFFCRFSINPVSSWLEVCGQDIFYSSYSFWVCVSASFHKISRDPSHHILTFFSFTPGFYLLCLLLQLWKKKLLVNRRLFIVQFFCFIFYVCYTRKDKAGATKHGLKNHSDCPLVSITKLGCVFYHVPEKDVKYIIPIHTQGNILPRRLQHSNTASNFLPPWE